MTTSTSTSTAGGLLPRVIADAVFHHRTKIPTAAGLISTDVVLMGRRRWGCYLDATRDELVFGRWYSWDVPCLPGLIVAVRLMSLAEGTRQDPEPSRN
jgi:hypothetical protein